MLLDHGTNGHVRSRSECSVCIPVLTSRGNAPDLCFRLCPVDAILTRMGAYDNMFSNSSTFKVELDEW
jgi:ferredoxin